MNKGLKTVHIILLSLSLAILLNMLWTYLYFGNISIDSMIFTLTAPTNGTDISLYISAICIFVLPVIVFIIILILIKMKKVKKVWLILTCDILIFLSTLVFVNFRFDVVGFLAKNERYTNIYDNPQIYVDPKNVKIEGNNTNNLIFIYLESVENSFSSFEYNGGSKENLIPELTNLALENTHFSNTDKLGGPHQISGTSWSIAAVTATMTGLTLNYRLQNSMNKHENFMPGAYALGDILESKGYYNEFICGADVSFGGGEILYTEHGNYEIYDERKIKKDYVYGEEDICKWGIKDNLLFEISKDRIEKAYQKTILENKKFNIAIEGIDCHTPDGYKCKKCGSSFNTDYKNIIACQSKLVNDFIEWNKTQPWFDNTTFVLIGDHTSMAEKRVQFIKKDYERTTYNVIINSKATTTNYLNRDYTTMDYFPTTLAALGFTIEGDKLALGTNLFSDKKTVCEEFGTQFLHNELLKKTKTFDQNIYGEDIYKFRLF